MSLERFTPTRVGTMLTGKGAKSAPPVHPHARGDNCIPGSRVGTIGGSPPRAWGQWQGEIGPLGCLRFTPTRVGTMWRPRAPRRGSTVHPHARGDNTDVSGPKLNLPGSPPRAWGQYRVFGINLRDQRFTPTRVGTIGHLCYLSSHPPVHPHARGDNGSGPECSRLGGGSPPRAWGQSPRAFALSRRGRFTPTRVGTIPDSPPRDKTHSVHPHARGDNDLVLCRPPRLIGSPPRAWGQ